MNLLPGKKWLVFHFTFKKWKDFCDLLPGLWPKRWITAVQICFHFYTYNPEDNSPFHFLGEFHNDWLNIEKNPRPFVKSLNFQNCCLTCHPSCSEKILQILQEVGRVVSPARSMYFMFNMSRATIIQPCKGYLEGSVASNEGGKLGQALLSAASNTNLKMAMWIVEKTTMRFALYQHHIPSWVSYDPRYLYQVDYCIREKYKIHVCSSENIIVLFKKGLQP